ncbi:MAG TPA: type 4 pilus major pilin [Eoetvoesiella sp.]
MSVNIIGARQVFFRRQKGFSLIEVSIVTAIVLLLAIVGIPAIGSYVVENKVPKVGEELARFVLQTKVNSSNGSVTPYAGIDTSNFANLVRDSSVFSVTGSAPNIKVFHGLGSEGEVSVSTDAGDTFTVTLSNVSNAACPSIASVMQRVSDTIAIAPDGLGEVIVKNSGTQYSALVAESKCAQGDVNTFKFTAS